MKFKYSVIGDNTPENREWLEKIGYEPFDVEKKLENPNHYKKILAFIEERWYTLASDNVGIDSKTGKRMPHVISCIGNPDLFKAVTSVRDDSDYMQWFTDGVDWFYCEPEESFDDYVFINNKPAITFHKATLSELQEHFKKVERL